MQRPSNKELFGKLHGMAPDLVGVSLSGSVPGATTIKKQKTF